MTLTISPWRGVGLPHGLSFTSDLQSSLQRCMPHGKVVWVTLKEQTDVFLWKQDLNISGMMLSVVHQQLIFVRKVSVD